MAVALIATCSFSALAQPSIPKVALVIANSNYDEKNWTRLNNPVNDARLINDKLKQLGFMLLPAAVNLNRSSLLERLSDFRNAVKDLPDGSVALIYYSGHGLQVDGENFLIPIGALQPSRADSLNAADRERWLSEEYVPASALLKSFSDARMERRNVANVLILDACRSNPWETRTRSSGKAKGLADLPNFANTLVAFAAAPGTIADDGGAGNSPYASVLATVLASSHLPLELLFNRVTSGVLDLTDGRQRPDYRVGLSGVFCLSECTQNDASFRPQLVVPPSSPQDVNHCELCPQMINLSLMGKKISVSKSQITVGLWKACVSDINCPDNNESADDNNPVTKVSFKDTEAFVKWLNSKTGKRFRLITSEEWDAIVRLLPNTEVSFSKRLRAASTYPPNLFKEGYIGQVVEWTSTCGTAGGCANHIARGSMHSDSSTKLSDVYEFSNQSKGSSLGFRVVLQP
ncbi:caspase family protein [Novosphingobium sp. BL-52-GroH]|uniref:caspase family protein n=1 Tax=Novosphingobium sp. BL-52-GroH TaxID=3349877 RepID=UPI00385124FF